MFTKHMNRLSLLLRTRPPHKNQNKTNRPAHENTFRISKHNYRFRTWAKHPKRNIAILDGHPANPRSAYFNQMIWNIDGFKHPVTDIKRTGLLPGWKQRDAPGVGCWLEECFWMIRKMWSLLTPEMKYRAISSVPYCVKCWMGHWWSTMNDFC